MAARFQQPVAAMLLLHRPDFATGCNAFGALTSLSSMSFELPSVVANVEKLCRRFTRDVIRGWS
jgi:hypothetical protein